MTNISFRQFSAVSCVHLCPSTHQSQGKLDDTHFVHELYVLQSKKVKFVSTRSGPFVILTESFAVKWCCPWGMEGNRSVLGVVQFTPKDFLEAFVISVLSRVENAQRNWPERVGRFSMTNSRVLAVVRCN